MAYQVKGKSGQTYHYRTERVEGKVVRRYIGCGKLGEALAEQVRAESVLWTGLAEAEFLDRCVLLAREREYQVLLEDYLAQNYRHITKLLTAAGYHRPKRGIWRKKRGMSNLFGNMGSADVLSALATAWGNNTPERKQQKKEQAEREALQKVAQSVTGSMHDQVHTVVMAQSGGNKELAAKHIADFQQAFKEITGAEYSTLERTPINPLTYLMVERVLTCRMEVCRCEVRLARAKRDLSQPKVIDSCERSLSQAHKRFLIAVKMMAEVHHLAGPQFNFALPGSIQLNVADKQINATSVVQAGTTGVHVNGVAAIPGSKADL